MSDEAALQLKIRRLSEAVWEDRATGRAVEEWLSVVTRGSDDIAADRIYMLQLLSSFLYFGIREIRELLNTLYKDLYRRPLISSIRKNIDDPLNIDQVDCLYRDKLRRTRFLGVGNPSESGSHLLYYLRQETRLPADLFANHFELPGFVGRQADADHYVFIDDLCGTGEQACKYSQDVVSRLKEAAPEAKVSYFALFATTAALARVRSDGLFSEVECVMELGEDFKCFSDQSRFWTGPDSSTARTRAKEICLQYGRCIYPYHPLGFDDAELAIGFNHNTPDDTLPIFWVDASDILPCLRPIFRRYEKAA